ncbi:MAG: hypothetical protein ACLQU1_08590 [Bryobacteraceae bacterium]
MAPLYGFHIGWENEQLAHFLLSRFSFVAHPATIGDDVGSDFYCTIFDILDSDPPKIEPRISFAIQVKSNADRISAGHQIAYLDQQEVPFFVGVVDQATASLKIHSAECLPMMFANYGYPGSLSLRLVDKPHRYQSPEAYVEAQGASPEVGYWETEPAARKLVLNCFHVCTFSTSESRGEIRPKVEELLTVCRRATMNIGSKRVDENLFDWPNEGITVSAGPESAKHFRDNTLKRLAEAFYNFAWILGKDPSKFDLAEFEEYEKFFLSLRRFGVTKAFSVAYESYKHARHLVDRRFSSPIESTGIPE